MGLSASAGRLGVMRGLPNPGRWDASAHFVTITDGANIRLY